MSYKGFKSERAFYNAKCHALTVLIVGEEHAEDCLHNEVERVINNRFNAIKSPSPPDLPAFTEKVVTKCGQVSIKDLTDDEARRMYFMLLKSVKGVKENEKAVNRILKNSNDMSEDQRRKIIRLTKYKFNWKVGTTFAKILEYVPRLRKRLTPFDIQNTKILALFSQLKKNEADKVIKRLEKIEMQNSKSKIQN